jgi:predicted transport protein
MYNPTKMRSFEPKNKQHIKSSMSQQAKEVENTRDIDLRLMNLLQMNIKSCEKPKIYNTLDIDLRKMNLKQFLQMNIKSCEKPKTQAKEVENTLTSPRDIDLRKMIKQFLQMNIDLRKMNLKQFLQMNIKSCEKPKTQAKEVENTWAKVLSELRMPYANSTILTYRREIKKFIMHIEVDPTNVQESHFKSYAKDLVKRNFKQARNNFNSIKLLAFFLENKNSCKYNVEDLISNERKVAKAAHEASKRKASERKAAAKKAAKKAAHEASKRKAAAHEAAKRSKEIKAAHEAAKREAAEAKAVHEFQVNSVVINESGNIYKIQKVYVENEKWKMDGEQVFPPTHDNVKCVELKDFVLFKSFKRKTAYIERTKPLKRFKRTIAPSKLSMLIKVCNSKIIT